MAQGRCSAMALAAMLAICAFAAVQSVSAANTTTHNVGDSNGWRVPANINGGFNYTVWADSQTYYAGDKLFFAYPAEVHTVWSVSGADFKACNTSASPLFTDKGAGNTTFSLDNAGNYWFICSVGSHCTLGMKFKITVLDAQKSAALSVSASFFYSVAAVAATMAVLGIMVL